MAEIDVQKRRFESRTERYKWQFWDNPSDAVTASESPELILQLNSTSGESDMNLPKTPTRCETVEIDVRKRGASGRGANATKWRFLNDCSDAVTADWTGGETLEHTSTSGECIEMSTRLSTGREMVENVDGKAVREALHGPSLRMPLPVCNAGVCVHTHTPTHWRRLSS